MQMLDFQEDPQVQQKLQQLLACQIDEAAARAAIKHRPRASIDQLVDWAIEQYPRMKKNNLRMMMPMSKMKHMTMFDDVPRKSQYDPFNHPTVSLPGHPPTQYQINVKNTLLGMLATARENRQKNMPIQKKVRKQYLEQLGQTDDSMHDKYREWIVINENQMADKALQEKWDKRSQKIYWRRKDKCSQNDNFGYVLGYSVKGYWQQYPREYREIWLKNWMEQQTEKRKYRDEHPELFKEELDKTHNLIKKFKEHMADNGDDYEPQPVREAQEFIDERIRIKLIEADKVYEYNSIKRKKMQEQDQLEEKRQREKQQMEKMDEEVKQVVDLKQLAEDQTFQFEELIEQCNKLKIYSIANTQVSKILLDTLIRILEKVDQNFDDKKYRKLKRTNETLKDKVFKYPEADNFLNWLGFSQEDEDEFVMEQDAKDERQLKKMIYILREYRRSIK